MARSASSKPSRRGARGTSSKKAATVPQAEPSPPVPPGADSVPPSESAPLSSAHTILDEAVAEAARTISRAAAGEETSREQLTAAQDILNRKGITAASKTSAIPEAFARDAFATVFRLLGFPEIKWPKTSISAPVAARETITVDDFNKALADV